MRWLCCPLILITLFSCKPEPKIPQWETQVLTPLINSRIEVDDLLTDSLLQIGPEGAYSLQYRQEVAELIPDEIIEPLNDSFRNVIRVDDIDLGSPSFSDFITLGDLSDHGSTAGALIIANNGQRATVPPFPNQGPRSFPVDATGLFQSITLSQGNMRVEIENELPVALTNIDYQLQNQGAPTPIAQGSLDTLRPGETYQRNFSLANEQINGQLEAVLVRFSSPGSGTDTVLIDTSDQVIVRVALSQLEAREATAIFPDQVLASDTSLTSPVKLGQSQLTAIVVGEGGIFLDAESTIEDEIQLDYNIPSATRNNQSFSVSGAIPPAAGGQTGNLLLQEDLTDYRINLQGLPGSNNVYNQFYTILLGRIDSSGRVVTLSRDDSLVLQTGIRNLVAKRGYGYLGGDTLTGSESATLDIFNNLSADLLEMEGLEMAFEFENFIGAPMGFQLDQMSVGGQKDTLDLVYDDLGQVKIIPAASENGNGIIPNLSTVSINPSNSNITQLFSLLPEEINSSYTAYINPGSIVDYNQFIYRQRGLKAYLTATLPLDLKGRNIEVSDTAEFDYFNFDKDEQWQSGTLNLIATNRFPASAEVFMRLYDENDSAIHTLIPDVQDKIASAVVVDDKAVEAIKSVVEFPIDIEEVALLKRTQKIVFFITINTDGEAPVIFSTDDFLDLTLSADLNVRTR